MSITAIVCVAHYKNKLAIGRNNSLLLKLKDDLHNFSNITQNNLNEKSKLLKPIVVMGRKTWFSIPRENRPLKNRINIIITNDKSLHILSPFPFYLYFYYKKLNKNVYYMSFSQFEYLYKIFLPTVYVIGGSEIYDLFFNHTFLFPKTVFLTEVYDYTPSINFEPTTFFTPLSSNYQLKSISDNIFDIGYQVNYRFLTYYYDSSIISCDSLYLNLTNSVINTGLLKTDRTNTGTLSTFGQSLTFDMSTGNIPLLTTKFIPWKHVILELLWFLRGDSDAKILQKDGVKIWNGHSSREFLDSRGLYDYDEGVLGPMYGWQFRFFGAPYSQALSDTSTCNVNKIGGFDQLKYVINELKTNPNSRRILISLWNPLDFKKVALYNCHYSIQFYVRNENNSVFLDCLFNMRSSDVFLGLPFNIFSYAVLTFIIAKKCNMTPGKLIYNGGDVHVYSNHLQQIKEQSLNYPRSCPQLFIDDSIEFKDWNDISINDFQIIGYFPHNRIKAIMAV